MVANILLRFVSVLQIILTAWGEADDKFQCGKIHESSKFIVNEDNSGTWPWMASLGFFNNKEEWVHQCGTTLISQYYFLTAAHCVKEKDILSEWKILTGTTDLKLAKSSNMYVKILDIKDKVVHSKFNGEAYFDVALIRTELVNFTERVSPICLPELSNLNQEQYYYRLMYVTGWGSSSLRGATTAALKRATVQGNSQKYCNDTHLSGRIHPDYKDKVEQSVPQLFQSQIMCAGQPKGMHGICKGDSGGPLFFHNNELNTYLQIGIVHGAIGECGLSSFPGIYVRIDDPDIWEFIKSNTKDPSSIATTYSNDNEINSRSAISKETKSYTKVAVALGLSSPLDRLDDIEVIDLSSENTKCQNLQNFPYKNYRSAGGSPGIICGGSPNKSSCHSLQNESWKPDASLLEERVGFAMTGSPFPNDGSKNFVTGGEDASGDNLKSSEILTENGWQFSIPLPTEISNHCMVMINSTSVMVIGGLQGANKELSGRTFILDGMTKVWKEGPELKLARFSHSCSMIKKNNLSEDKSVIVVGGADVSTADHFISSTEVLEVGSSEWKSGPNLPMAILGATMVEDPTGGAVLIGGDNHIEFLDKLFILPDARSDATWEEMPQKLKTARKQHNSFLIPDELAQCN